MSARSKRSGRTEIEQHSEISSLSVPDVSSPACSHCEHRYGFSIPHSLVDSIARGDAVVFAGAGISTENHNVYPRTLHTELCHELKLDKQNTKFPDAAEVYGKLPDGRIKLIRKIGDRFSYIDSFAELRDEATEFHQELATITGIDTVITTNWDTYFERFSACQPFVLDADMAFWESASRRVLKIHGSIENFGTVTATRSDYKKKESALRTSLIGSRLKTILATKTVIFAGYSLGDEDFIEIMRFVKRSLGSFSRQHYIITIDNNPETIARFKQYGLTPIVTDAKYFLESIKSHLVETTCVNPDSVYDHAAKALHNARRARAKLYDALDIQAYPDIIYCACYHDGLVHILNRIVDLRKSGAYSDLHSLQRRVFNYNEWKTDKLKAKKYEDVAYIYGYLQGMEFALRHRDEPNYAPPLYFVFAQKPFGLDRIEEYVAEQKKILRLKKTHRGTTAKAKSVVKELRKLGDGLIYRHKCQLL
jgi:hypothetical protein